MKMQEEKVTITTQDYNQIMTGSVVAIAISVIFYVATH